MESIGFAPTGAYSKLLTVKFYDKKLFRHTYKMIGPFNFDKKLIVCLRERTLTFFFRTTNPAIAQTIGIAIAATIEAVQVFRRLSKITSEDNRSISS